MKYKLLALAACAAWSGCSSDVMVLTPYEFAPGDAAQADASEADASEADASEADASEADASEADAGAKDSGTADPPLPERRLASAFLQTCAIRDGALFCWGDNSTGQAGGAEQIYERPTRVTDLTFLDVCSAAQHSCALRTNGTALCWGANDKGQLGVGEREPHVGPAMIFSHRFASVACGGATSCGINAVGDLFCWGENEEGQLGQAGLTPPSLDSPDSAEPRRVAPQLEVAFRQVSVGEGHVCAVTHGDELYCWGRNTEGQLGVQDPRDQVRAPALVELDEVWRVAAGQRHTCAIDRTGRLYCWGDYLNRSLEDGFDGVFVRTPTRFGEGADYEQIGANWFHSCARERGGALSCWGRNVEGQLGLGHNNDRFVPTAVEMTGWRSFAVGKFHTCGFRGEELYCWGVNAEGELGLGDMERRSSPSLVTFP